MRVYFPASSGALVRPSAPSVEFRFIKKVLLSAVSNVVFAIMPRFDKTKTIVTAKDKKLRELVLYISERSINDDSFGLTKLNKLLFFADFLAYLNFGKPITGQEYFRLRTGPAPRNWLPIRRQMLADGEIRLKQAQFYGFPQDKVIPLREPNLEEFSSKEIALIDKIVETHRGKTASEISDESHEFVGWQLAKDEETIPYQVARLMRRPLNENELKHAKSLEKRAVQRLKQAA
jgi:hypothetical protein